MPRRDLKVISTHLARTDKKDARNPLDVPFMFSDIVAGYGEIRDSLVISERQVASRIFEAEWKVCVKWAFACQNSGLREALQSASSQLGMSCVTYEGLYRASHIHPNKDCEHSLAAVVQRICPQNQ